MKVGKNERAIYPRAGVFRVERRVGTGELQVFYRYRCRTAGGPRWRVLGHESQGFTAEVAEAFAKGWHAERAERAGRPVGSLRLPAYPPSGALLAEVAELAALNRAPSAQWERNGYGLFGEDRNGEGRWCVSMPGGRAYVGKGYGTELPEHVLAWMREVTSPEALI